MENVKNASRCFDCNKKIEINGQTINNGYLLCYKDGDEEIKTYKCKECYDKNPALSNFRNCEVYSRVVGYIRPVSQWNIGKKREYGDRKEFTNN